MSAPTLVAYCYVTAGVIHVFIHLGFCFKNLQFIHEIPMPPALLEEKQIKNTLLSEYDLIFKFACLLNFLSVNNF